MSFNQHEYMQNAWRANRGLPPVNTDPLPAYSPTDQNLTGHDAAEARRLVGETDEDCNTVITNIRDVAQSYLNNDNITGEAKTGFRQIHRLTAFRTGGKKKKRKTIKRNIKKKKRKRTNKYRR
jgi:hypothetical protein